MIIVIISCWGFHLKYAFVTSHNMEMCRVDVETTLNKITFKSMPCDFLCLFPANWFGQYRSGEKLATRFMSLFIVCIVSVCVCQMLARFVAYFSLYLIIFSDFIFFYLRVTLVRSIIIN